MRVGDLKKTSNLIKEYFPSNYDYTELNGHSQTKVNTLFKLILEKRGVSRVKRDFQTKQPSRPNQSLNQPILFEC